MNDSSSRKILFVFGLSFGLLVLLSALPIGELTGHVLKDFDLFEDLFPAEHRVIEYVAEVNQEAVSIVSADTTAQLQVSDMLAQASADSAYNAESPQALADAPRSAAGGIAIESYCADAPLRRFADALSQASTRLVRIAMIGDSFIEGDIITQDLRDIFQRRYGGAGVGFMAMHSDFPGFRHSVRQTDKGWTMHDVRSLGSRDTIRTLSGDYARLSGNASVTFKGVNKYEGTRTWDKSTFLCLAPKGGVVTLTVDGREEAFTLDTSACVQRLCVAAPTSSLNIKTSAAGLVALGAYLDSATGVQVDCMSVRGNSGAPMAKMNVALASQMAKWVPYDLIIVEYGTNALTFEQKDYSPYAITLANSLRRIKDCYPQADIILLGVADRGMKRDGTMVSMPTCTAMVKAQREAAAKAGVCFWDTREAMGADGAAVAWRKKSLMNADYTHINHKGGAELARLLSDAIFDAVSH